MPELDKSSLNLSEEERVMLVEIDMLKCMLLFCSDKPGANITITIEHDCGNKITANLYDHAALVQGLYDALDYLETQL